MIFDISSIKITRSSRKSIAIFVRPDGSVDVKAPKYIPEFAIKVFVKSKTGWIEKRLDFITKNTHHAKIFINGEKFLLLGQAYELLLGNFSKIETKNGKLLFPLAMATRGKSHLEKWYILQAKNKIKSLVEEYATTMNASFESISFSDTSSKWGSCTHDNRLQFNWRLVMAPLLVVRYVVIHELTHTTHKNHSRIFWNKVRQYNPSYKEQIKWLKINGNNLRI